MVCHPDLRRQSILLIAGLVVLPVCYVFGIGWPQFFGPVSAFGFVFSQGLAMGSWQWCAQCHLVGIGPAAANISLVATTDELRVFGRFRGS